MLRVLVYGEPEVANLLDVRHPETIRKLYTCMRGSKLSKYKNVECLVTNRFDAICKDSLLSLPKLRELRYSETFERAFEAQHRSLKRLKQKLKELLDDAKERQNFRFIFAGLRLTETNVDEIEVRELVKYGKEVVPNEYAYMNRKNYQLIDGSLEFVDRLDYNLLSSMTKEIPACFSRKFANVKQVEAVGTVQDPTHFLSFLKALRRSLSKLRLDLPHLGQEFYDQLPASADSLVKLELRESVENQLNFDFIDKIPLLSSLSVEQPLLIGSLSALVRCSRKLVEGSFSLALKKKWFFVKKEKDSTKWKICEGNYRQIVLETENPNEIRQYFERLQSHTSKAT